MKAKPSIRELARLAGCSSTAVSMALRNHPRISLKTREKVQRLAEKHGYTRDPVVSTLMNRLRMGRRRLTTDKLGVLAQWDMSKGEQNHPLSAQAYAGICQRANHLGYEVECFGTKEPGMTAKRLSSILHARSIRGIILCSVPYARGHMSLDWAYFAAATMGSSMLKPDLPRAFFSPYNAMMLALRNLRRRKYARVGYLNLVGYEDMANDAWLSAYLGYHFRTEEKIAIPPLIMPEWDQARIGEWLEKYRPEVILSSAARPYFLLQEMGYRIPRDIGYATLDHVTETLVCAGIRQPREWMGSRAVDLVVEQLENHEFGLPEIPKNVLINGFWKDGPTLLDRRK